MWVRVFDPSGPSAARLVFVGSENNSEISASTFEDWDSRNKGPSSCARHGRVEDPSPQGRYLLQVAPILTHPDLYQQRHRQRVNIFHVIAHQGAHGLDFLLGDLEHQLIVNL